MKWYKIKKIKSLAVLIVIEGIILDSREESDTTEHICTRIFYVGVDSNFFLVVTFILE